MLKNSFSKRKLGRKAQLAVIITFIIAVVFLLFVAYVNIYRVADSKIMTSQSADKAALFLASQIGSYSRVYLNADPFLGETCITRNNLLSLVFTILTAFITAVVFVLFPSPLVLIAGGVLGGALGASFSAINGIERSFRSMSLYNGFREAALFNALQGVVTDDVELRRDGNTFNYVDDFSQDSYDFTTYNLEDIVEARSPLTRKYGRFAAWFQTRRFQWSGDAVLNEAINVFINDVTMGMKRWAEIPPDTWDESLWRVTELNFLIWTQNFVMIKNVYDWDNPRCPENAYPAWVKDENYIRALHLKADNSVDGGFIYDKFVPLLKRLKDEFGALATLPNCPDPLNCEEINLLVSDFKEFLFRVKELLNIPQNERLNTFEQWFSAFYVLNPDLLDPTTGVSIGHCENRNTIDTGCAPYPESCPQIAVMKHDVWDRLTRDMCIIQGWIDKLEKDIDPDMIMCNIPYDHGYYCIQGRGTQYDSSICYTDLLCACEECCAWDSYTGECTMNCCIGYDCITPVPYFYWGAYGTCTGPDGSHGNHPVCQTGDLFGAIPGWCCNVRPPPPCVTNNDGCGSECDIPLDPPNYGTHRAYKFQGQFSWVHTDPESSEGPTEVGQAVRVLKAILEDLKRIRMSITTLYQTYEREGSDEMLAIRNQLVYAWTDKKGYSHMARAFMADYPEYLPYHTEELEWDFYGFKSIKYCLQGLTGEVQLNVSRYDQDLPVSAWYDIRRRKKSLESEYDVSSLKNVVRDLMNDGKVDWTQPSIEDITNNYAISSSARAAYGPTKPEIKLIETEAE